MLEGCNHSLGHWLIPGRRSPMNGYLYSVSKILLVAAICGVLPPMKIEDPPPKNLQTENEKSQR